MTRWVALIVLGACGDAGQGTALDAGDSAGVEVSVATDTSVSVDGGVDVDASGTGVADADAGYADADAVEGEVDAFEVDADAALTDAEVTNPADVADVTNDVWPNVAECPVPTLQQQYPGPLPPSPFEPFPLATDCLAQPHDVVIVLGCPSEGDGSASDCQTRRAEMADQLYEAGWAERFITTGGAVHNAHNESEALKVLLVGRGIPAEAVVTEPLAQHTDENIYYSTRIMEAEGWRSAIVVSENPGHLVYTGLCDTNCCVELGRMTLLGFAIEGGAQVNAGHYALGGTTTDLECLHITTQAMCINQDERKACKDDFQLP